LKDWRLSALAGGIIGALFHLAWHMNLNIPPLSGILWEWGGIFAHVPRLDLIGLHLFVLVPHVVIYATLGVILNILIGRFWRKSNFA